jgi:hypothetical protein
VGEEPVGKQDKSATFSRGLTDYLIRLLLSVTVSGVSE